MEPNIIKARESQLVVESRASVLHFEAKRGLVLCFFLDDASKGGGTFVEEENFEDERTGLQSIVENILREVGFKSIEKCSVKIIGTARGRSLARDIVTKAGLHVVSEQAIDASIEAFFYTDTGRLRLRESLGSTLVENVTSPEIRRTRVLIVDDSKTIRQLLSAIIASDPELEVVGVAERPSLVENLIKTLKPDVMTLDINMPEMDGVTLVEMLLPRYPIPTVMITALSMEDGNQVLRALELGAVDYIQKPSFDQMGEVEQKIRDKIKTAALATVRCPAPLGGTRAAPMVPFQFHHRRPMPVIAIGASTGGTEAIRCLLQSLPEQIPPIVIVQHIPAVFSTAFAKRLNELCLFEVLEAKDGDELRPGRVLVAPGGFQMSVSKWTAGLRVEVRDAPTVSGHRPSVDVLFGSVAESCGSLGIGVILTGMGGDGAQGLLKMRHAGARTLAQDELSCVVYGMPAVAVRLGAAEVVRPLGDIAEQILDWTRAVQSQQARFAV